MTREQIARIIHPGPFTALEREVVPVAPEEKMDMDIALAKADAILALSPPEPTEGRKLMPLEPTDEALLNGARSIGLTIGMENHIERARHCYRAFMSDDRQPIPTGRPLPLQDRSKP